LYANHEQLLISGTQERQQDCSLLNVPNAAPQLDNQSARQYWMPPHVRACPTTTGAVVLDLKRNRYFGVGRNETRALFTLELDWSKANLNAASLPEPLSLDAATRIAEDLVEAGLLSRNAPTPTDDVLTPGTIDLGGTLTSVGHQINRSVTIRFSHAINFFRACAWAKHAVRSRTLYSVACQVSSNKSRRQESFDMERAIELACIFRRLRPFTFTAKEQCLFHALALVKFLSCYQVFPTWVIGVRARPWAAHSWVQEGSLLLDSNPEHVCEYMPILTV
jgi:hypothetical protein